MKPLVLTLLFIGGFAAHAVAQTSPDPVTEIAALRAEIARHDDLYFRQAAPEISDGEYDDLKRQLTELEHAFPAAAAAAPRPVTASLGDDRTGAFATHPHREPMLSLDKCHDEAGLRAFHAKLAQRLGRDDLAFVIEPKVDGIAISVTFEHGRLVRAVTRGDGTTGDDITANVRTIAGLPYEFARDAADGAGHPIPDLIELRGEIHLTFAEFERINREREANGEPLFANPRNAAAGSAKLTDPQQAAARRLSIVFHGWGACEPATLQPATQSVFAAQLQAWGLPVLDPRWQAQGADEVWTVVERFGRERSGLAFPTDGVVVKLDDAGSRAELGSSAAAPRWAIACKYAPERAETQLLEIAIQVGRTGVLTPVAELAPVALGGTTVARASLHNRGVIARRDLRVGDFVTVEKAGEIIPTITAVNLARRPAGSQPFVFPTTCPACSAAVTDDGAVVVRCPNARCPAQLRRRLEHFASKDAVDIDGLGAATIDLLVTNGWVHDISDLYALQRADLLTLGRDLEVSTDKLLAAIARSQQAELWRFIRGLGIAGVGEASARELARQFGDLESLTRAAPDDFSGADHTRIGTAVRAHFAEPQNRAVVHALLARGVRPSPPPVTIQLPAIAGKIFVLTGRLPHFTRAEATQKIEAAGGTVRTDVSRNTDFVVAGEEPGSKLDRAHRLGITVIDEAELLRLLAGPP